jgi:hypothetical protein
VKKAPAKKAAAKKAAVKKWSDYCVHVFCK